MCKNIEIGLGTSLTVLRTLSLVLCHSTLSFNGVLPYPNPVILVHFSSSGDNDFSLLVNEVLTLPSTTAVSTAVCRSITVPAVMIVENNETFTITVETSNPNDVVIGPSTATITIVDIDGKLTENIE